MSVALGAVLATSLFASLFFFQIVAPVQQSVSAPKPAQAPQELQKFKILIGSPTYEGYFLVLDAAKDRGIWAKYGLDPEVSTWTGRACTATCVNDQVAAGVKMGFFVPHEIPLARSNGVPVKMIAGFIGEAWNVNIFVNADGPIKTLNDLDGKKVGVVATDHFSYRHILILNNKFGIKG